MHRFKVGEKVIVKAMSERPLRWNSEGKMDRYMGTVQVIESLEELEDRTCVTLYGCKNSLELDWIFRTEDLLPVPEPGDKVRIRSWEGMRDQYGLDDDGDIKCKYFFTKYMGKYAGGIFTVSSVGHDSFKISTSGCVFSFECIEEVYKKEDEKVKKFRKEDLKNGMTVTIRNEVYLVIGETLLCSDGWLDLSDYNDDLTFRKDHVWDIQDVCGVNPKITGEIRNILSSRGEMIWKREAKEIYASEAMKTLREKYGCEVKIVEDKDD